MINENLLTQLTKIKEKRKTTEACTTDYVHLLRIFTEYF